MRCSARFCWTLLSFCFCLSSVRVLLAEDLCVECEIERLQLNTANGVVNESIDRLKQQIEKYPDNRVLHLLLATAYYKDDNAFWAMNTLYQWLEKNANDCEAKSFLIWFQIKQGEFETANALLEEPTCPQSEEMKTRWTLLTAFMFSIEPSTGEPPTEADHSTKRQKKTSIKDLRKAYPEDRSLWDFLWKKDAPDRQVPFELKIGTDAGYTSNGAAGSPADTSTETQGSGVGKFELLGRFIYPTGTRVRPAIEVSGRMHGLGASEMKRYSYVDLSYRPGLIFGRSNTLLVAYRGNMFLMATPGQKKFYEAHRLEIDLKTVDGFLLFGGVGKRFFKQNGRTRIELDGGFGGTLKLNHWLFLLGALNGKYYSAVGSAYDQGGVGVVTSARFKLPGKMRFRTGIGGSLDFYFHSGGDRGENAYGTTDQRRDFTVRHFDELWFPPIFERVEVGIRYEYNHRDSSADLEAKRSDAGVEPSNYDYLEHRLLVRLNFSLELNPFSPRIVKPKKHVELNYGIDTTGSEQENAGDEIAELLREDEAVRAASSCVE